MGSVHSGLWFSPTKLSRLLGRIEMKGILVILIAPDWSRWMWYFYLVRLTDASHALPDCPNLLSMPFCFMVVGLNSMAIEARVLWGRGILELVDPTMLMLFYFSQSLLLDSHSLGVSFESFIVGNSQWDKSSPSYGWVWSRVCLLVLSKTRFLLLLFCFPDCWPLIP